MTDFDDQEGKIEDQLDSNSKRERDFVVSGRSRDRDGEKVKERSREKRRDWDRERPHRTYHDNIEPSERRERGSRYVDDYRRSRSRGRDHDSRRDGRGVRRSRQYSRSRSRVSRFDVAPPASAMLATVTGQVPRKFSLPTGQVTKHACTVFVGGISSTTTKESIATFFNQAMDAVGGKTACPGDAVREVYMHNDQKFAFVEMRYAVDASNALALNGIIFEGTILKVTRPSFYNPHMAATLGPCQSKLSCCWAK